MPPSHRLAARSQHLDLFLSSLSPLVCTLMARAPLQSLILHRGCLSEAHLGGSSFFLFSPDLILAAEGFKSAQHDYLKKKENLHYKCFFMSGMASISHVSPFPCLIVAYTIKILCMYDLTVDVLPKREQNQPEAQNE